MLESSHFITLKAFSVFLKETIETTLDMVTINNVYDTKTKQKSRAVGVESTAGMLYDILEEYFESNHSFK